MEGLMNAGDGLAFPIEGLKMRSVAERPIESVALGGGEAGFADEALYVGDVQLLVGAFAGAFGDVVPDDGAVEVVAAVGEGELGEAEHVNCTRVINVGDVVE